MDQLDHNGYGPGAFFVLAVVVWVARSITMKEEKKEEVATS